MKYIAFLIPLLILAGLPTPVYCQTETPVASDSTTGKLIIYRPGNLIGAIFSFPIWVNEQKIGSLSNDKSLEVNLPPGEYELRSGGNKLSQKESMVQIVISEGKTQYVRCHVTRTAFGRPWLEMIEVMANTAKRELKLPLNSQ
ncbi:MAG TPA: DUF2846 domain-containing protein [Bacteroidetes bacterium]|nr:DUF2846 domain-containing protein [Bacteroidota bacterium]